MTYSWAFVAVAVVLVLTPGADFAVIVRNTVTGGRQLGVATTLGVSAAVGRHRLPAQPRRDRSAQRRAR